MQPETHSSKCLFLMPSSSIKSTFVIACRSMEDRGKTRSSNVPGWLGVSHIELASEEEAHRLQVLIQELLAAIKPRTHALFIS